MKFKLIPALALILIMIVQMACSAAVPAGTPDTAATLNGLYTAAAQTSTAAALTPFTTQAVVTQTPGLPLPTASPIQPVATSTPFVLPTSGPVVRCDAAAFVKDVTIADGSVISRGASFTKTWRLQNVGTCAWTPAYALVFVSGDSMSGPTAVGLGGTVQPGQSIDLSATMIAPSSDGHFRGYWKLRNASYALFGIGTQADTAFWVDIYVRGPSFAAYDFVSHYCEADWENNNTLLPCPGVEGDDNGFVIRVDLPKLENGDRADGAALLTIPKNSRNGLISGTYPALTVQNGDHFKSLVSCAYHDDLCNVIFKLEFKSGGQVTTLGTWNEVYEGKYFSVDVDLSSLAGKTGKFILTVLANGSARDDEALWVQPRIVRNGNPPPTATASLTPTPTATATITLTPTFTATSTASLTPTP